MAVFRSRGTMSMVRDLLTFVMVASGCLRFHKERGGNGTEFTRLVRCTFDYFKDKFIWNQNLSLEYDFQQCV